MPEFDLDTALEARPLSWSWTVTLTARVQEVFVEYDEMHRRLLNFDAQAGSSSAYSTDGQRADLGVKTFVDSWEEPDQTRVIYCEVELSATDAPFTWTEEEATAYAERYFEVAALRTLGPALNRAIERSGTVVLSAKENHA